MTTATTGVGAHAGSLTTMHKAGLGLAALLALFDLTVPFLPHPGGDGPPPVVEWTAVGLGLVTLAAVWWAVRSSRRSARWLVAGTRALSALLALPALWVDDVPTGIRILVAVLVALAAVSVSLVLSPSDRRAAR